MGHLPPVRLDLEGSGNRKIDLTAQELIAGHGSPLYVAVAGLLAGILLWIPVIALFVFNRMLVAGRAERVSIYQSGLGVDILALWPYIIASGLLGIGLALLRRVSARIGWYKELFSQRLGLNGAVASVLGAIVCIGLIASGSQAGILLPFISIGIVISGYIVNALWEGVHNFLLGFYGANTQRSDRVLELAARHELQRRSELRPTRLQSLTVQNGKMTLQAEWASSEARQEAQEALRGMTGVALVQFERMDE